LPAALSLYYAPPFFCFIDLTLRRLRRHIDASHFHLRRADAIFAMSCITPSLFARRFRRHYIIIAIPFHAAFRQILLVIFLRMTLLRRHFAITPPLSATFRHIFADFHY